MLLKNKFEKCELVNGTPDATKQLRVKLNPSYGDVFKEDPNHDYCYIVVVKVMR